MESLEIQSSWEPKSVVDFRPRIAVSFASSGARRRLQPFEFDAGFGSCELPVRFGVMFVSIFFPGGDFLEQGRLIGNSTSETLGGEHAEFGLGHVQPASVLGRVMPFEAFDETARFRCGKGGVERGGRVRAQIVLNQHDLGRVREMGIGEVPECVGQNVLAKDGVSVGVKFEAAMIDAFDYRQLPSDITPETSPPDCQAFRVRRDKVRAWRGISPEGCLLNADKRGRDFEPHDSAKN